MKLIALVLSAVVGKRLKPAGSYNPPSYCGTEMIEGPYGNSTFEECDRNSCNIYITCEPGWKPHPRFHDRRMDCRGYSTYKCCSVERWWTFPDLYPGNPNGPNRSKIERKLAKKPCRPMRNWPRD